MTALRPAVRVVLITAVAVPLLWATAQADHANVSFSQTSNAAGGTAISGLATSGSFSAHAPVGVYGRASAPSGLNMGVVGLSSSTLGRGVFGAVQALSGDTVAVLGTAASTRGKGVFGTATALSGTTFGVDGESQSNVGIGVRGRAINGYVGVWGIGKNYGVQGSVTSPTGAGVLGVGINTGVYGNSTQESHLACRQLYDCAGVVGNATALNIGGNGVVGLAHGYAVRGDHFGQSGAGVRGFSQSRSGSTFGVDGETASTNGTGVRGFAPATSGPTTGVFGVVASTAGTAIRGQAFATSGSTVAIRGEVNSPAGVAIHGIAPSGARAGRFDGRVDINCPAAPCLFVNGGQVADLAEDLPAYGKLAPGDVVVLAPQGNAVARTTRAYDTRVAGIVSGQPRVRLRVTRWKGPVVAVGMVGVVRAKATAANGQIRPGDLLTTSKMPGHVMRCPVPVRCVGAIVGKAMEPLVSGKQQILVMLWRQ